MRRCKQVLTSSCAGELIPLLAELDDDEDEVLQAIAQQLGVSIVLRVVVVGSLAGP